jgi:hypothetical protein
MIHNPNFYLMRNNLTEFIDLVKTETDDDIKRIYVTGASFDPQEDDDYRDLLIKGKEFTKKHIDKHFKNHRLTYDWLPDGTGIEMYLFTESGIIDVEFNENVHNYPLFP